MRLAVNVVRMSSTSAQPLARAIVSGEVMKVDDSERVVYGYAIVSTIDGEPYYDSQGDYIPDTVMRKAATDFMLGERESKVMHDGEGIGRIVHSFPLTADIAKAYGFDTDSTGWLIGMHISDDEVLRKFKSGELTGFSIGGRGVRIEVEDDDDGEE